MGLSPFCVLSEGEEDEGAGVPYGMGDDEGREASREEAVDEAPAAAYDSCRHDQHEVERRQMDERVAGRGGHQSRVGAPARHHPSLDEAAPEDLLCRTDDEEEQDGNDGGGRAALHGVDHIYLAAGETKHPLRHLVARPEHPPQHEGDRQSRCDRAGREPQVLQPLPTPDRRERGEGEGRTRHRVPEVDVWRRTGREHHKPQQGCDEDGSKGLSHFLYI